MVHNSIYFAQQAQHHCIFSVSMWFLVMWFLAKKLFKPWRTRKQILIADRMLTSKFWTVESLSLNLKVCLCGAFSVLWLCTITAFRFYKAVFLTDSSMFAAKKDEKKKDRASPSSSSSSSDSKSSSDSSDSEESEKESKKKKKKAKKLKKKQKKKEKKKYLIYCHILTFCSANGT